MMSRSFTRKVIVLACAATGLSLIPAPAALAASDSHQIVYRVYGTGA